MEVLKKLEKSRDFWFLLISSFVFFLLRLPSLFEPYWYGDEGVYQVLGMGINHGRLLYRDIFDNKPPLLYILYSLFNSDQFLVRLVNSIFGILALIAFFYLSKKLFTKTRTSYITTGIFGILLGIPLIEGNIANAENFMLLPIIVSGILILSIVKTARKKNLTKPLFLSGILLGIAFLFKIVAVFDFAAFLLVLVFTDEKLSLKKLTKINYYKELFNKYSSFLAGFFTPVVLTFLFFLFQGAISDFTRATFFSNIGYVGYGNKFIVPQGLLILKLAALALFCFFVLQKKDKLQISGIFIYLWFGFSLFNAFFSQRPYTHYLLVLLPSFSLLIGFLFTRNKWQKLSFIIVLLTLYLVTANFNLFKKTRFYYQNFLTYVTGSKNSASYQSFFDRHTPVDYEIAQIIKMYTTKNDNIFIWGNNAQLYKMTNKLPPGKYAVSYHITNYKDGKSDTLKGLRKTQPKLIIIMPNSSSYPFSLEGYSQKMAVDNVLIYERIY